MESAAGVSTTQQIYDFIVWAVRETGLPPSTLAIMVGVGLKSTSTVNYHIHRLERMGLVKMVNRRPLPVCILEYLKLFQITQKESIKA